MDHGRLAQGRILAWCLPLARVPALGMPLWVLGYNLTTQLARKLNCAGARLGSWCAYILVLFSWRAPSLSKTPPPLTVLSHYLTVLVKGQEAFGGGGAFAVGCTTIPGANKHASSAGPQPSPREEDEGSASAPRSSPLSPLSLRRQLQVPPTYLLRPHRRASIQLCPHADTKRAKENFTQLATKQSNPACNTKVSRQAQSRARAMIPRSLHTATKAPSQQLPKQSPIQTQNPTRQNPERPLANFA
ncbi:uncharacterized protein J3D65DRAFT_700705 [Phyllosticta citribraziliensis]|uniref:Uncharacterized protein n=1 Tax=Phyllosticta citribraziliensis TaxID=989973 RepID=A0ABR1LFV0_9PEZI